MSLRKPASTLGSIVTFVLGFIFVGLMASCVITIGIWPGQVKLLAPLFCTDAQPDAFVVADTFSPQPGETVTNFSLYCMGPRGDATDHGFIKPFALISVVNGLAVLLLLVIFAKSPSPTRRQKEEMFDAFAPEPTDPDNTVNDAPPGYDDTPTRAPAPPGSTKGPFVD